MSHVSFCTIFSLYVCAYKCFYSAYFMYSLYFNGYLNLTLYLVTTVVTAVNDPYFIFWCDILQYLELVHRAHGYITSITLII